MDDKKFIDKLKEELEKLFFNFLSNIFLYAICWGIGFYLLINSSMKWNINNEKSLTTQLAFLFLLSIFLILIPLVKSIKFFNIFELEKEIKQTKDDIKDFKTEIRQSVSLLTNSVNASIGNMHNNITVQMPGTKQLKEANRKIDEHGSYKEKVSFNDVKEQLSITDDEDIIMALARTRIKIETLLREVTGPTLDTKNRNPNGTNDLFRLFVSKYPEYGYLKDSFRYVLRICNAGIHGTDLSYNQAQEAIDLGFRIIKELEFAKQERIENFNK